LGGKDEQDNYEIYEVCVHSITVNRQWSFVCLQEAGSRQLAASSKEQDISEAVKLSY
jgi:hypothetical protein